MFEPYLSRWRLESDGEPILTRSSRLLPVRMGGMPAMLKIAIEPDEKFGGLLMAWWDGQGAARVFEHEGDALLMERAMGSGTGAGMGSLLEMALSGRDDEASRIICLVVTRRHPP